MKQFSSHFHRIDISRILGVVITLFISLNVNAQLCYYKGYVVTISNDTISGFISDNGVLGNSSVCKYKETPKSKTTRYLPGEIKSYRFIDDKYYKSLEVSTRDKRTMVFAEVLLDDEVSLYSYWKNFNFTYYLVNESGNVIVLPEEMTTLLNKSNKQYYSFIISAYKDSLEAAFANCNELMPKIEQVEYNAKDLIDITKEYIYCTCETVNPIRYEKDFTRLKLTFGLFSGAQVSKIFFQESDIQSNFNLSFPYGIFLNAPIPLLNERLSFQIELYTNRLNYNNGFFNLPPIYKDISIGSNQVCLPLLIKYSIFKKKFTPSLGLGKEFSYVLNSEAKTTPVGYDFEIPMSQIEFEYRQRGFYLHHFQMEGWFVDLGIDYKINNKISVFSSLRFKTYLNLIIEEKSYNNHLFSVAEKMNNLDNPHSNIYRTYSGTLLFGIKF